ncbi:hypothetical protein GOBAR_DD19593 [Gossypium barbadense]|nr:hypothetical protein GOBAR_DD19593 [Gossypium barbadense]
MCHPGTAALVLVAPPEAQVQLKPLPEYINKYIVSERPRPDGKIDKYYRHKELHLNFLSLAEVERYESKGIYPGCAKKKKENEDQIGLHEPLLVIAETTGYIIEATPISTLPLKAQAPTPKRRYNKLKPLPEFLNNWIVIESPRKNRRIDKKYHHKECNITLRSLLELLTYGETGEQNEELAASTMERINFENMHMSNLTASASTAPNGRRGRKRKMKTVASSEAEANIGVEQNDETAPIDVPINDEAAPIDVPIIDEVALIDVSITYVENFSDLGR